MKRKIKDFPKNAPTKEQIEKIMEDNPTYEDAIYKIAELLNKGIIKC